MDSISVVSPAEPDELIPEARVKVITGTSKSSRWRWIAKGDFPKPIRITKQCTRWSLREVSNWVEDRKRERAAAKQ
jgi:prophage regulatory protein